MKKYPQVLINCKVGRKVPLEDLPALQETVSKAREKLGQEGRLVLRYSGTEPLVRVMLEGPDEELIEGLARRIGECIVASID